VSVGKSSELEVLEANAGVSLRQARRNEAEQKLNEAATQLSTMFSGHTGDKPSAVRAVEAPQVTAFEMTFYDCYKRAFELNPDYLSRKSQALAENIRLAYAKNQLLPQLDLKGSYGLNGLGSDVGDSFEDVRGADYPAWSVGVELRIPVTGGMKERNEYKAAQLNRQKALISIKEAEVQLGNALSSSLLKVRNLRANIASQREVIGFHEQLLETQLARLDVGVVDSRAVFETEEKLFQARIDLLETMVDFQKALLENELYQGGVLEARNMDLTKAQLQEQTSKLLAANRFGGPELDTIRSEVQQDYQGRVKNINGRERSATLKEALFE
jgi:outer membrane protein TolC